MSVSFAEVNGARIHYDVQGQGSPLLLIHAGIVNMGMWDDQMGAFARHYRVIRYDIRGWGDSTEPPGPYSDYEDLASLLTYLEVDKAIIAGVSFGGGVAIDFALAYPERTAALVLVGAALGGYDFQDEDWTQELLEKDRELDQAYERGDKARAAELAAQIWVDGPARKPEDVDPAVRAKSLAMIHHTFELPDGDGERMPLEPAAITRLEEIKVPTFILVGELDVPGMFNIAEILETKLSRSMKAILPGTAHLPNVERPAEFNRLVLDYLAGL